MLQPPLESAHAGIVGGVATIGDFCRRAAGVSGAYGRTPVEHRANVGRTMPRARGNDDTRRIEAPRTETPRTDERRSHTPCIEAPRDKTPRKACACGASMRLQTQVSATTPAQGDAASANEA